MTPMQPVRIVIFAKAPQAGLAKTRLIPVLGAQGAADLALKMLTQTVSKALAANLGTVELCMTPAPADPAWRTFHFADALQCSDQGDGDLGARMARATQRVIEGGESILLIGTDCPQLGIAELQEAAAALQVVDATMFPTVDGGYALLGLNCFDPSLFAEIAWSTNSVAATSLQRLEQLRWTVKILATLRDIDEPEDLHWLEQTLS